MRVRGLLLAFVALAALGGGIWWSEKTKKADEAKGPADASPKLITVPEDQFQQVEIRKKDGASTVVKRADGGKWQLTAPKPLAADQEAVNSMVSTLSSLGSDKLIEDKATDWAQYGLATPSMEVILTKKDGKAQKLLVGDETPTGGGFFVRLDADPRVFTMASYSKTSIDKTWTDLRDKRLLTFEADKLVRVELSAKKQNLEFAKNNQNEWQILKPRPLRADSFQVEEIVRKIKDAKMDTSVSEEDAKKAATTFAGATVVAVAKATDAAGTQQLEVRKTKDNDYYAKSSAVEGVHKVAKDLGDGLDKGLEDVRNKKLFDFGFSDPGKIEVRDGAKSATYQKSADKWMSASKQMDSASVQSLVDKLRELASIKFVDAGFTTAIFEASVSSNDGKRNEKVLISKSGNSYFAKRENEPSIYELDGKAVEELQKIASEIKEFQPPKDDKKKAETKKK